MESDPKIRESFSVTDVPTVLIGALSTAPLTSINAARTARSIFDMSKSTTSPFRFLIF
ncbi:MAG: hypothetical protein IPL87_00805 [Candidatus Moraniibacteriota bacterium]|nr:MAG: hypothetical protein IPL87_00805 [Candidatus Moranbacteria bacterium]